MPGFKPKKIATNSLIPDEGRDRRPTLTKVHSIQFPRHRSRKKNGGKDPNQAGPLERQTTPNLLYRTETIAPGVAEEIRRRLIDQETAFQRKSAGETFSSLWAHSCRVGRIARRIARMEGWDEEPALLAGLLHDAGKFAFGTHHDGDIPEERNAVRFMESLLSGTPYERWIPEVRQAILSTYLEGDPTNESGRAVYDADCLDKLGNMGVVQFFVKKALRRSFLDNDMMIRTSIELTYAHHAPHTLKTPTGRILARDRCLRTRRFYAELLEEWAALGLGEFKIVAEEIAGIECIFVVPTRCSCGGAVSPESDILDSVKCRSAVVTHRCDACGIEKTYSFCLPNLKGLPPKMNTE